MTVNGKPVKTDAELQAALNAIPAGTAVKIVYKVGDKDRTIEGVSK
jgi:S1-C subfamily serine protease